MRSRQNSQGDTQSCQGAFTIEAYLFIYLFSLYLKLTFPSLQLKPINVN